MALDAGVVGANIIQLGRVHDVRLAGIACVVTARTMASFTTDIPFDWRLRLYVVIDGMAAITQRPGWALHVIGGIEGNAPICVLSNHLRVPDPEQQLP